MSIRRPYRAVGMLLISVLVASVMALACDNADLSTAPPVPGPTTPGAAEKSTQPSTDPATPESTPDSGDSPSTQLIWSYEAADQSGIALEDGVAYVVTLENLLALDAATGELLAQHETDVKMYPPTLVNGILYGNTFEGASSALDTAPGNSIWSYETNGALGLSPAVVGGVVYFGSSDGFLNLLEADSGNLVKRYQIGGEPVAPPVVVDGVVYLGSAEGYVYALDTDTGELLWHYLTGADIFSSPTVADGVVYIASMDNTAYALTAP